MEKRTIRERSPHCVVESTYTHWLPLITRCPLSWLPDFVYVKVTTRETLDLYEVRKEIYAYRWRKMFMEDLAVDIAERIEGVFLVDVLRVEVTLLFGRHYVRVNH
jgi:NADPH-dependent 7-cyano-7-deazaguanine reductase QueF